MDGVRHLGPARVSGAVVLLLAALALLAPRAGAAPHRPVTNRCDWIEHICWEVDAEAGGDIYLRMTSADHGGEFDVCVKPLPKGRQRCRTVALRHRPIGFHGPVGWGVSVDFQRAFPPARPGTYEVRWTSVVGELPLDSQLFFRLYGDGHVR
jgi:hypothetical protein